MRRLTGYEAERRDDKSPAQNQVTQECHNPVSSRAFFSYRNTARMKSLSQHCSSSTFVDVDRWCF
jgi:hypothetical protein